VRRFRVPELVLGIFIATAVWAIFFALYPQNYRTEQTAQTQPNHQRDDAASLVEAETTDERLARYTLWLMLFTGVLAASTIGLWIVTWLGARRQARDMEGSITAAKDSADAAREANSLARDQFVSSERPWVWPIRSFSKRPIIVTTDKLVFDLQLVLQNFGKSPATMVTVGPKAITRQTRADETIRNIIQEAKTARLFMPTVLGAGETMESPGYGFAINREDFNDISNTNHTTIIIVGVIDYQFMFQTGRHMTPFYLVGVVPTKQGEFPLEKFVALPISIPAD
jgi:hypothetical protein